MAPVAAFFILVSVLTGGHLDTVRITCPDLVCVGKAVDISMKRPEVTRVRVYGEEPASFGPGEIYTPALADYSGI